MQKLSEEEGGLERWLNFAPPIYIRRLGSPIMTSFASNRMEFNLMLGYWSSLLFGKSVAIILAQPIPFWKVRLWWNRLFIRKDEFHHSLEMDVFAMLRMTDREQKDYLRDLVRRRNIAHERDLEAHY